MLSTRTSRWVAATVALCVLMLVATYLLLVSPRRSQAAEIRVQRDATITQNDSLQARIAQLRVQYAALPQKQAELAEIRQQMPPTSDIPRLIRDLDEMALTSGVMLNSLTPGDPQPLMPAQPAPVAAAEPSSTGSQPAATAAAGAAPVVSTAAAGTVIAIPTSVKIRGDYYQAAVFLKKLQTQMPRAFLVKGLTMMPAPAGISTSAVVPGLVDLEISGQVYVLRPVGKGTPAASGVVPGSAATPQSTTGTVDR